MARTVEEFIADGANALMRLARMFPRGTFTDAVGWVHLAATDHYAGAVRFGFIGSALKVSMLFRMGDYIEDETGESGMPSAFLVHACRQALGAKETGFEYDKRTSLFDFLSHLPAMIEHRDLEVEVDATFMPEPGYPYPEARSRAYFSARRGEWVEPPVPPWLIDVAAREVWGGRDYKEGELVRGANPCVLFPPDRSLIDTNGALVARSRGPHAVEIMVAHSMRFDRVGSYKQLEGAIAGVKACGGLLFPSLSVGPIPASNFGPISLIAPVALATRSLERRVNGPMWVYPTDAWTDKTGTFLRDVARELFEQLHGHDDYLYGGGHIWTLGPPSLLFSGPADETKALSSVPALVREIRSRMAPWRRDLTEREFEAVDRELGGTAAKYAYCEGKGREVIAIDTFPFILAPRSMEALVREFAEALSYRGGLVLLDDEGFDFSRDYDLYRWAWRLADRVRALREVMPL